MPSAVVHAAAAPLLEIEETAHDSGDDHQRQHETAERAAPFAAVLRALFDAGDVVNGKFFDPAHGVTVGDANGSNKRR